MFTKSGSSVPNARQVRKRTLERMELRNQYADKNGKLGKEYYENYKKVSDLENKYRVEDGLEPIEPKARKK